jgi:hypothetical protein
MERSITKAGAHVGLRGNWLRGDFTAILAAALVGLHPATAVATPYTSGPLVFSAATQSMWGPGNAPGFNVTVPLTQSWNTGTASVGVITGSANGSIPNPLYAAWLVAAAPYLASCAIVCIEALNPGPAPSQTITVDTRTGGVATASTKGTAGFRVGASADSGSVNATVSYLANLTVPNSAQANQFVNLNPASTLAGTQSLTTNSPEFAGKAEALLGAQAALGGTGCFIGFGCASGNTTVGFPTQTIPLVSFNDPGSPGEIKILGLLDPALFQFGQPIEIPPNNPLANYGNVTVHVPDINTTGGLQGNQLKSSGKDDFIDLRVDLDGLVLGVAGLPPVLGTSVSAGPLNVGYDLIDIEFGPTLEIIQDFELTPSLMVDFAFSQPVNIAGVGLRTSYTSAWDSLPSFAFLPGETIVTPEFWLDALFKNMTSLGVDGVFQLTALRANFSIQAFGLSLDIGELGPLFQITPRADLFQTPALFSSQFDLGGFNRIAGAPFAVLIPEPNALALLAIGLLVLAVRRRRVRAE